MTDREREDCGHLSSGCAVENVQHVAHAQGPLALKGPLAFVQSHGRVTALDASSEFTSDGVLAAPGILCEPKRPCFEAGILAARAVQGLL